MKLYELAQHVQGTYAGVRFCEDTKQAIHDYMAEAGIPNMLDKEKLHTTLLYSRKHCPNYEPLSEVSYLGEPSEFVIWDTQAPNGGGTSKCLVLKYDCPELVERHRALREEHGATHDYPEYTPHITLSYNIGNMRLEDFPDVRKHLGAINIVSEYSEPLDLSWASKA